MRRRRSRRVSRGPVVASRLVLLGHGVPAVEPAGQRDTEDEDEDEDEDHDKGAGECQREDEPRGVVSH